MFRAVPRFVLSLLAAFAVLLGTLEHEDLILQDPSSDAHAAASALPTDALSANDSDSGTEGTFRLHLSRFWLSPPANASKPLRTVAGKIAPRPAAIEDRRPALAGHLALRL